MSFLSHFSEVTDPRTQINVQHDFIDVIFLTVSAVLSGAEGWSDIEVFGRDKLDWLRQYRPFENGIPVDDTPELNVVTPDPVILIFVIEVFVVVGNLIAVELFEYTLE